jgi:hypothetical protein
MSATLNETNEEEETFVLSNGVLRALREIADIRKVSPEEALAYAVASGRIIVKETSEGARVVIRKNGSVDRRLLVGE